MVLALVESRATFDATAAIYALASALRLKLYVATLLQLVFCYRSLFSANRENGSSWASAKAQSIRQTQTATGQFLRCAKG